MSESDSVKSLEQAVSTSSKLLSLPLSSSSARRINFLSAEGVV